MSKEKKGINEIIRVKRLPSNFVQMHKGFFEDSRLSFKAKGILGYLLTKPDNWEVRVADLMNHAKDGRDSIYAGLKELQDHKYYYKVQSRNKKGRLSHWECFICEVPMQNPNDEIADSPYTEKPFAEEPFTVKPNTENTLLSNNKSNKNNFTNNDSNNNKPTPTPPADGNHGEAVEEKIKYAEFITMTNDEYASLVAKIGEVGATWCIEKLDNYKGSTGKKYDNDYRTILSWVIGRYQEHLQSQADINRGFINNASDNSQPPHTGDAFEDYVHLKIAEVNRHGAL
jgi:hypothetical protein